MSAMSTGNTYDEILRHAISKTTLQEIQQLAEQCIISTRTIENFIDSIEKALVTSEGRQRLMLWYLIDKLAKHSVLVLDALRSRLVAWAINYCPSSSYRNEQKEFMVIVHKSFAILFGAPLIALIDMQLKADVNEEVELSISNENATLATAVPESAVNNGNTPNRHALMLHTTSLRSVGGFMTKAVASERPAEFKHRLQVKTIDSQMAMNVASSYAPARPVEIAVPALSRDEDAPEGYMKALPENYASNYASSRRKRLREVMERNLAQYNKEKEAKLLQRVREREGLADLEPSNANSDGKEVNNCDVAHNIDAAAALGLDSDIAVCTVNTNSNNTNNNNTNNKSSLTATDTFSDVQMPVELPRDEFGVRKGNFPLGVRFIRNAILACGGAVELDVLVSRISTLSNRAVLSQFGNVREFLLIHSPTFRIVMEDGQWIVRLTSSSSSPPLQQQQQQQHLPESLSNSSEFTWRAMTCPGCSKIVKGRNFARHYNSRQCITAQIALGLQGDYVDRGPIAELAYLAKQIIANQENVDDDDIDTFARALWRAAQVRRFRLASPRQFAPVLKALRVIRDMWLQRKGVKEVDEVRVDPSDSSIVHLLEVVGQSIHRLPIAWIETGDVIDMCHRFTHHVEAPFNPPPRPADPRTSLSNEYPGFLFCESDIDDEDEPSGDEDEFSDDDAPAFTFAPPVETAESLFTAGFDRDTRRLQHRMRTAPPMILQHVLQADRTKTQSEMYKEVQNGTPSFSTSANNYRRV